MPSSFRKPVTPSPGTPSPLLAEAISLHRQGRMHEAQARYARILQSEPGNTQARYYQGLLRLQGGETAAGIAALKQVVKRQPDHAEAHYNLGLAYSGQGNSQQALRCFERVVALQPDVAEAQFYLGMTLARLGRQEAGVPHLERAIVLKPGLAEAHLNLGSALNELGRFEAARTHFERALALKPGLPEAHNGLGNALASLGKLEAATAQFKQAIIYKPDFADAFASLGHAWQEMGQSKAARACWEKVIEFHPTDAMAHAALGRALSALGEHSHALDCFAQSLHLDGAIAEAHLWLGQALFPWGRYSEGVAHMERAISMTPENHIYQGSMLFPLHYLPELDAAGIAARHRAFAERFEVPLKSLWQSHDNTPDPERRLRVGFVSADFRRHPVGYFMADLLASLNNTNIELYAYVSQWKDDDLTERIKPHFAIWRTCESVSDDAMATLIRADNIDILVDLSGHTDGNRLLVFARKPAPVQVTYLGYFDTTGLGAMDYILGNRWLLPECEAGLYTEQPWWLPDSHLCFTPPDVSVAVCPLPAYQKKHITFGCFNKLEKLNTEVIACWARLMHAVPGSQLLLKCKPFGDAAVAERYRDLFASHGIGPERLILEGESDFKMYLESHKRVDIALDPYPYNGGTTTVQALWMGVPVVVLQGDHYVAHMGESILHTMNMPEWIAADEDDYVAKAVAYASDLPALAALRAELRSRLLESPICDAPRFARNLEMAFRGMWRKWCEQQKSLNPPA